MNYLLVEVVKKCRLKELGKGVDVDQKFSLPTINLVKVVKIFFVYKMANEMMNSFAVFVDS